MVETECTWMTEIFKGPQDYDRHEATGLLESFAYLETPSWTAFMWTKVAQSLLFCCSL